MNWFKGDESGNNNIFVTLAKEQESKSWAI